MPTAITVSTSTPGWGRSLAALLSRGRARAGAYRVVGIDGRSGSGKTCVAEAVAAESAGAASIVHLDDLYPGWDGLAAVVPLVRAWVIGPLLRGADPCWRRYDWELGAHTDWQRTPVADVLLVEGCGAGARELRPYLSALVWVTAPPEVRADRLERRSDAALYAPHLRRWARQEAAFYAAHRPDRHADIVLDNG